ncbi:MAG: hypothetical protein HC875_34170, partial [Anaerolineales bacterium]|nr:hypothetical protein [Anaerolineales bacterium]
MILQAVRLRLQVSLLIVLVLGGVGLILLRLARFMPEGWLVQAARQA